MFSFSHPSRKVVQVFFYHILVFFSLWLINLASNNVRVVVVIIIIIVYYLLLKLTFKYIPKLGTLKINKFYLNNYNFLTHLDFYMFLIL